MRELEVEPGFFDDAPPDPWRQLWQCVLIQAARDAALQKYQAEIRLWLESSDFISVCLNAGYEDTDVLKAGIRRVMASGVVHADPAARRRRIDGARQARIDRQLARAEARAELDRQIAVLRAEGKRLAEIAQKLGVSPSSVSTRVRLMVKAA